MDDIYKQVSDIIQTLKNKREESLRLADCAQRDSEEKFQQAEKHRAAANALLIALDEFRGIEFPQ